MKTKTIVKVVSLYDLINNNLFILLATLHHIIILIFNYYYIYTLDNYINNCEDKFRIILEELQTNLEYCQGVTMFTFAFLFIVIAFNTDSVQLNQNRVLIMGVSFMTKTLYSIYQFYDYKKHYMELIESNHFSEKYIVILLLSYQLRLLFPLMIAVIGILICGSSIISYMMHFAKNYKFTVVERINANNAKL
jgi:hypothetical protein